VHVEPYEVRRARVRHRGAVALHHRRPAAPGLDRPALAHQALEERALELPAPFGVLQVVVDVGDQKLPRQQLAQPLPVREVPGEVRRQHLRVLRVVVRAVAIPVARDARRVHDVVEIDQVEFRHLAEEHRGVALGEPLGPAPPEGVGLRPGREVGFPGRVLRGPLHLAPGGVAQPPALGVELREQVARGGVPRVGVGLVQHRVLPYEDARVARFQRLHHLAHRRRRGRGVAVRVPAAVEAEDRDVEARELLLVARVVVVLGADVEAEQARELLRLRRRAQEQRAEQRA